MSDTLLSINNMPIYEFECKECKDKFEKLMPMTKVNEDINCPPCSKSKTHSVNRTISTPSGFIFKGSGFFRNDYPKG